MDNRQMQAIKANMPTEDRMLDVADLFKNFADSTRIKIMCALVDNELCVSDLAQIVGSSESAVSHQLRLLRIAKLVKQRRDGKEIYYSLDDDHVHDLLSIAIAHLNEQ